MLTLIPLALAAYLVAGLMWFAVLAAKAGLPRDTAPTNADHHIEWDLVAFVTLAWPVTLWWTLVEWRDR